MRSKITAVIACIIAVVILIIAAVITDIFRPGTFSELINPTQVQTEAEEMTTATTVSYIPEDASYISEKDLLSEETDDTENLKKYACDNVVLLYTEKVVHGKKAKVIVKGLPNTEYTISVEYASGKSKATGLENKTTDESGKATWEWRIGARVKQGKYPITVGDGTNKYKITFEVE